jgi:2-C-methyl-D-erythritol 4-phosphate cytidylyltransferase
MFVSVILLAAGKGERFKSRTPKPLARINRKPAILYSLESFSDNPNIQEIIVVANRANNNAIRALIKKYRILKVKAVVLGGRRRQDSVHNGLKAVDGTAEIIAIHDSARPFALRSCVDAAIIQARRFKAAILGVPVKATIKTIEFSGRSAIRVDKTIDRNRLWEIQTPQVFRKELLFEAYRRFGSESVTDDAMLVEKLGIKPHLVMGSYDNIKITTPEDLNVAEAIAKKWILG